jgi:hypothetical protein
MKARKWVFAVVGSLTMLGSSLGIAAAAAPSASASAVHSPSITVVDT